MPIHYIRQGAIDAKKSQIILSDKLKLPLIVTTGTKNASILNLLVTFPIP